MKNSFTYFLSFSCLLLVVLFIAGCRKETVEEIVHKSNYVYEGTTFITPYSLFQINDTALHPQSSNYTLAFFSDNVRYSIFDEQFVGSGSMMEVDLNSSIFKAGMQSQVFKVDNLQEGIVDIQGGYLYTNYQFSSNTGNEKLTIDSGTLIVWKYKDKYKLNYKITLQNGKVVEGAFWDALSIVYK